MMQRDEKFRLNSKEKSKLHNRRLMLLFYLLRSPCYNSVTRAHSGLPACMAEDLLLQLGQLRSFCMVCVLLSGRRTQVTLPVHVTNTGKPVYKDHPREPRRGFIDNEPPYDNGFVTFMLQSICPSLFDKDEEGSGFSGLQMLAFMDIARRNTGNIPGDDEDGYQLDVNLYELCHDMTTYDGGMVDFVVENICPLVFGDEEKGSHWPGSGPDISTFTDLVQALSPKVIFQILIRAMVESTCKSESKGQRLDSFCRFHRDGIKVSGLDGGSGSGSGSGEW
eukprot:XP_011660686.1 PREDICTED: uncharacterized protein LOC105436632 [Strongylocentrotus purpuratus]